ncbi:hypothetical protein [Streptomyces rugosispiralis]|uniref:Restriction endonuclease type IV Mrr domain-containing protein n=1 Tax=Streptomyces rugosispiralis TaxID=2967341 RepID=A0ABT1V7I8_9ACTN|nr:hypothetical protein [Streptomyces rugosispiralis]MCQ8192511.1 hypothetical protein [Streptomyces rugosispiralis]
MTDNVPVRCPACRREQSFTPPAFPCACGVPVTLPVLRDGSPEEFGHRTWENLWVAVNCPSCGRQGHWPQPELGCDCGAVVRVPVAAAPPPAGAGAAAGTGGPVVRRPAFRPVTIRTARDAVTAAAQYLTWLGFHSLRPAEDRAVSGVDLYGTGVVAQVDPTTRPTGLRDIECLWLNGLHKSAMSVCFSLAGYAREARTRADALHLPLFIMDLTGTPQPVNDPADALIRMGPPDG